MIKGLKGRKTFVRKSNTTDLYKWAVIGDGDVKKKKKGRGRGKTQLGCNAFANSQGIDNDTKYVYSIIDGEKRGYMACDYAM